MLKEFEPIVKKITQDAINRYAGVTNDHNPIHIDEQYAKTTQFGGTIAHGTLTAASISEQMAREFGHRWLATGSLDIKFKSPARPGDTVTTRAFEIDTGVFKVECRNQKGELLITGTTKVGAL